MEVPAEKLPDTVPEKQRAAKEATPQDTVQAAPQGYHRRQPGVKWVPLVARPHVVEYPSEDPEGAIHP